MLIKKLQKTISKAYFEATLKYYEYIFKGPDLKPSDPKEYKKPSLIERLKCWLRK